MDILTRLGAPLSNPSLTSTARKQHGAQEEWDELLEMPDWAVALLLVGRASTDCGETRAGWGCLLPLWNDLWCMLDWDQLEDGEVTHP